MLKLNNIQPGSMIIDFDDVLVFTTNYWFKCIYDRLSIFEPYIDKLKIPSDYDYDKYFNYPMTRDTYYFADWLLKKDLDIENSLIGRRFIMEAYLEQYDQFYDKAIKTPLSNSLIYMYNYKDFKFDKIYIVTRTIDDFIKNKTKCIQEMFKSIVNNVEIIFVDLNEKKSDVVKDIPKISLIIDDELNNIYDYIDNLNNIENAIMLLPITGYNTNISKEYLEKARNKKVNIQYYNYNEK